MPLNSGRRSQVGGRRRRRQLEGRKRGRSLDSGRSNKQMASNSISRKQHEQNNKSTWSRQVVRAPTMEPPIGKTPVALILVLFATCCLIAPYCVPSASAAAATAVTETESELETEAATATTTATGKKGEDLTNIGNNRTTQQQQTSFNQAGTQAASAKGQTNSTAVQWERVAKLIQKYKTNQILSDTAYNYLLIAYSIFIIVGTTFNSLICLTVLLRPRILSPRNIFIVNLAASDLLLCTVTMPFSFVEISVKMWHLGNLTCKMVAGLQAVSIYVSTLSITAIAMDRYKVIVYPVHRETVHHHNTHNGRSSAGIGCSSTRRDFLMLACVWILALVLSSPLFYFRKVMSYTLSLPQEVKTVDLCVEFWPMEHGRGIYSVFVMIVQYIVPISIVSIVYAQISDKLKKRLIRRQRLTQMEWQQKRQLTLIRRTHAMLISVSLIFGLSWLPLNLFNVIGDFSNWFNGYEEQFYKIVFAICHLIGCSSACTNPILYAYLNENFRKECIQVYLYYARRLVSALRNCLGLSDSKACTTTNGYSDSTYHQYQKRASSKFTADRKLNKLASAVPEEASSVVVVQPARQASGDGGCKQNPPLLSLNGPTTTASGHESTDESSHNKCPVLRPAHLQLDAMTTGLVDITKRQDKAASDTEQPQGGQTDARRCSTMTSASTDAAASNCNNQRPPPFGATMRFCLCIRGSSSIETLNNRQQTNEGKAHTTNKQETSGWNSSSCSPSTLTQYDGNHSAACIKMDQLSAASSSNPPPTTATRRKWRRRSSSSSSIALATATVTASKQQCDCKCQCLCHLPDRSQQATRANICNSVVQAKERGRDPATGKSVVSSKDQGKKEAEGGQQVKVQLVGADSHDKSTSRCRLNPPKASTTVRQQGRRVWLRFLSGGLVSGGKGQTMQQQQQVSQASLCGHCEINCNSRASVSAGDNSSKQESGLDPLSPGTNSLSPAASSKDHNNNNNQLQIASCQKPLLKVAPISQHRVAEANTGTSDLGKAQKQVSETPTKATAYHYLSIEPVVMLDSRSACTLSEGRSTSLLMLEDDDDNDGDDCDEPVGPGGEKSQQSMSRQLDTEPGKRVSTQTSKPSPCPSLSPSPSPILAKSKLAAKSAEQAQAGGSSRSTLCKEQVTDDKLIAKIPLSPSQSPSPPLPNVSANATVGGSHTGSGLSCTELDGAAGDDESDNSEAPSRGTNSSSSYSCLLMNSRTSTCSCTSSSIESGCRQMGLARGEKQQQLGNQVSGVEPQQSPKSKRQTLAPISGTESATPRPLSIAPQRLKQTGERESDNEEKIVAKECERCKSATEGLPQTPTSTSVCSSTSSTPSVTGFSPPTSPSRSGSRAESSLASFNASDRLLQHEESQPNAKGLLLIGNEYQISASNRKSNSLLTYNGLTTTEHAKKNHCLPACQRSA